jgi:hypothetical protein
MFLVVHLINRVDTRLIILGRPEEDRSASLLKCLTHIRGELAIGARLLRPFSKRLANPGHGRDRHGVAADLGDWTGFAADSTVGEDGFGLSVPPERKAFPSALHRFRWSSVTPRQACASGDSRQGRSQEPFTPDRAKPTRPTLAQREAERDEGRGVVDQALALEHDQDPANVLAIVTWRNCFGYVANAEQY